MGLRNQGGWVSLSLYRLNVSSRICITMLKELVYVDMHRPSRLFFGYIFFKKLKLQLRRGNDRKQLYLGKIKGQPLSPCFCPLPNMGRVWEGEWGGTPAWRHMASTTSTVCRCGQGMGCVTHNLSFRQNPIVIWLSLIRAEEELPNSLSF